MNDQFEDEFENNEEEDFSKLLESYDVGMNEEIQVGDKIKGEIIELGMDSVFINTGTKVDGVVDKKELCNEDGEFPFAKGDRLDLYVVYISESEIRLSRALSKESGSQALYDAYKSKIPVDGKVTEVCKGGFRVDVMRKLAFCPLSQMDIKYVNKPEEFVGNTYRFMISRIEEKGRNIVVSRRDFLEIDLKEARSQFLKDLKADIILEGEIIKLMEFGVFVELFPGIEGMIHISELSWTRIDHPREAVKEGDVVKVKVIKIEQRDSGNKLKIALSLKQTEGDPWDRVAETFKIGDMVKGRVTRCLDFGAFVEIAPGTEGLVHISEMSYTKRIQKAQDVVKPGDTVSVMIKEIDPGKKRISLSIKDAEGDPWVDVKDKYPAGKTVLGKVERKETFGLFIILEPGVTGLLHKSKIGKAYDASAIEKLKPGEEIHVQVEDVNIRDRRITLVPADASDMEDWKNYKSEPSANPAGSLGEKLQQAIQAKEKNKK
ncbi:MAG: 30S ribosomal protein S1 [Pseudomonadota bacterium]